MKHHRRRCRLFRSRGTAAADRIRRRRTDINVWRFHDRFIRRVHRTASAIRAIRRMEVPVNNVTLFIDLPDNANPDPDAAFMLTGTDIPSRISSASRRSSRLGGAHGSGIMRSTNVVISRATVAVRQHPFTTSRQTACHGDTFGTDVSTCVIIRPAEPPVSVLRCGAKPFHLCMTADQPSWLAKPDVSCWLPIAAEFVR